MDADFTQSVEAKLTSADEHTFNFKKEITFSSFGKWRGIFRLKDGLESSFIFDTDVPNTENTKVYFING